MRQFAVRIAGLYIGGFVQNYEDAFSIGITNECLGTEKNPTVSFCPFLDFDGVYWAKVVQDIRYIQSRFNLGGAVVCSSKEESGEDGLVGNYQVFFFDKLSYGLCAEVIRNTRSDQNFKNMPRRMNNRSWVLRIAAKEKITKVHKNGTYETEEFKPIPKFKTVLKSKGIYDLSEAHWNFIRKTFKVKEKLIGKFDGSKEMETIEYRVWHN